MLVKVCMREHGSIDLHDGDPHVTTPMRTCVNIFARENTHVKVPMCTFAFMEVYTRKPFSTFTWYGRALICTFTVPMQKCRYNLHARIVYIRVLYLNFEFDIHVPHVLKIFLHVCLPYPC